MNLRVLDFMRRKTADPAFRRPRVARSITTRGQRTSPDALKAWKQWQEFMLTTGGAPRRSIRKREFVAGFEAGRRAL